MSGWINNLNRYEEHADMRRALLAAFDEFARWERVRVYLWASFNFPRARGVLEWQI